MIVSLDIDTKQKVRIFYLKVVVLKHEDDESTSLLVKY